MGSVPSPQGKLSLQGGCADSERVFALRGVGGPPVPEDHVVLHCPVGRTSHTQLDIPNPSRTPVTLKVKTDDMFLSSAWSPLCSNLNEQLVIVHMLITLKMLIILKYLKVLCQYIPIKQKLC